MKKFLLLVILAVTNLSQAQYLDSNNQSIGNLKIFNNVRAEQQKSPKLSKIVFGYLPDWQYLAGSHNYIRYDLLTHLAVFPYQADSTGALKDPAGWPWNDVISACRNNQVKLIMTIANFTPSEIHRLFNDSNARKNLINNIHSKVTTWGFDGVAVDFEYIPDSDKKIPLKNFLDALKSDLNSIKSNCELGFASPCVNDGYWDFNLLATSTDYLLVMCYNFYGSWSYTTGPSAPMTGGYNNINLTKTFETDYSSITTTSPGKLIMTVPYYGNYWHTSSKDPFASVQPYDAKKQKNNWVKLIVYNEIFPAYSGKEILWDNTTQTSWLRWQDTTWNQVWYDSDSSLAVKYNYTIKKNLKGIGIWALGYDDGRPELWSVIERKFGKTNGIEQEEIIPGGFALYQNYPNPFNPNTVIKYTIVNPAYVTLKVYDILGREITTLVDEFKPAGYYNTQFSTLQLTGNSNLSSGVYFYILKAGNLIESKKMVLIK